MEKFKCVEISYFNEENNCWYIDCWRTDDPDEEGRNVGVIHRSGDVYIHDCDALVCDHVKRAVADKVAEIKAKQVRVSGHYEEETIEVRLDPNKHPKAWAAKKADSIENGLTAEEAEELLRNVPFVMELYYSDGLYAVESDVLEFANVCNPYDGIPMLNEPKD